MVTLIDVRALTTAADGGKEASGGESSSGAADGQSVVRLRGAVNHPLPELLDGLSTAPPYGGTWPRSGMIYFPLASSRTLLLACEDGAKSLVALELLYDKYDKVYCVDGGIEAWEAAGLPTEPYDA